MAEEPSRSSKPAVGRTTMIGLAVLGFGVVGVGGFVFMMNPQLSEAQYKALRAEVPATVDDIQAAQLMYEEVYDGYVDQRSPVPRPKEALNREAVAWVGGTGFATMSWAPEDKVRGTYWIEVSPDGKDFTVHGMIDADEDGVPAHYTATREKKAARVTPPDVY